jgi:hypothetical protein
MRVMIQCTLSFPSLTIAVSSLSHAVYRPNQPQISIATQDERQLRSSWHLNRSSAGAVPRGWRSMKWRLLRAVQEARVQMQPVGIFLRYLVAGRQ